MFIINVALGNTSWRLLFKDEQRALGALALFNDEDQIVKVFDDFGQSLETKMSRVHGVMLEDMDKTKMAHVEMVLHQARAQNLATKMAQSDPALKTNAGMSPSVISPMNGFMPRQ